MHADIIHIVDDEKIIRESVSMALEKDYVVAAFASAEDWLDALTREAPDLVLLDIALPGMSGIEALTVAKKKRPEIPAIMITAFEDIETVVTAMKRGAHDYVVKPLHMETLSQSIQNALETIRLRKEVRRLQEKYLRENLPCFIAESQSIQDVMELVDRVAKSPDTPILILGETGTGKEWIAGAIHYKSPHHAGPFTTMNCAAIPLELVESELFGYERGAFTGADPGGKKGLVEAARNGTLFLDEIGDLNRDAQAKLLRFLESGEFYKVGGTRKRTAKTRIIAATNIDLEKRVQEERFRKDLFYRIGVIRIELPALNRRPEDILPIARYFLDTYNQKFHKQFIGFTEEAEKTLLAHNWEGNVRELKNRVERSVLVGTGNFVTGEDLGFDAALQPPTADPPPLIPTPQGVDLSHLVKDFERRYFTEALRLSGGNESMAARLLHLNHHTFRYQRKKLFAEKND
jgi:DNA-binding NtrC family response regulator